MHNHILRLLCQSKCVRVYVVKIWPRREKTSLGAMLPGKAQVCLLSDRN